MQHEPDQDASKQGSPKAGAPDPDQHPVDEVRDAFDNVIEPGDLGATDNPLEVPVRGAAAQSASRSTDQQISQRGGLPRYVVVLMGVVLSLAALLAMRQFASVVAPFFMALNVVIVAYPLHSWLVRKHWPRWLASLVMGLVVVIAFLAMLGGLVWAVDLTVVQLLQYTEQFNTMFHQTLDWLARLGFDQNSLNNVFGSIDPKSLVEPIQSLVGSLSSGIGLAGVVVLALMFLVMDVPSMQQRIERSMHQRPRITVALRSFVEGVRRYWIVTTVFGLIVAVLDGIAIVILGVPLPLVWALLSFLTNYIPNIGFIIGLIPPALVALVANDWQTALILVIAYIVLNFVVQSLIQPRIAGESVGVTPTVSFLSLLVWGSVLGGLGTLLALPMTLLVKATLVDADPDARWVDSYLAANPASSDPRSSPDLDTHD